MNDTRECECVTENGEKVSGARCIMMEKISTTTTDLTEENIEKLIKLFPQVATEVKSVRGGVFIE